MKIIILLIHEVWIHGFNQLQIGNTWEKMHL